MAAADYRVLTDATGQRIAAALEAFQAVPYVATIPTGQWSGSGSDRYITVQASNVTANSILIPNYDNASAALLNGPVWCVPAAGSFTIHTSAIPSGTVTIMVQLVGTLGEAQYQVLADVYSKSQVDSIVAQSTAKIKFIDRVVVNNNTASKTYTIDQSLFNSSVGTYVVIAQDWSSVGNADLYLVTYSGNVTSQSGVNRLSNNLSTARVTVSGASFTVLGSHIVYALAGI